MTDTPVPGADGGTDGSIGDTTVRRPRIPSSPEAIALVEGDQANDTVVVRRVSRDRGPAGSRPLGESSPHGLDETITGVVAAYPSRVAAPVRGSRRTQPALLPPIRGEVDPGAPLPRMGAPLPDASGIRRAVRARARRRLVAVVVAMVALVVVLAGALIALVFAVGV